MKRLSVWLWGIYDFANSLANIAISFYFVPWFVQDLHGSDLGVSLAIAISTIILLFILPAFGRYADRVGSHMLFLRMTSILSIVSLLLLGWVGMGVEELTRETALLLLVLYGCFQFFFQAAFAFYSAFIRALSDAGTEESISGFGIGLGQPGNVIGLFALLPIVTLLGRPGSFFAGGILFLLFALPTLLFLRVPRERMVHQPTLLTPSTKIFTKLWKEPNTLRYLIAYYFFADAVLTLQVFVSLYLGEVGGLSDKPKTLALAAGVLMGAIGGFISARISRRIGDTKRAISWLVVTWAVLLAALALANTPALLLGITALNGLAFGVLFSLSRAFYARIIPAHEQAEFFSIYVLFERASSVLGPLVWSAVLVVFSHMGTDRYRIAMFSLALMVMVSYFILKTVRDPSKPE